MKIPQSKTNFGTRVLACATAIVVYAFVLWVAAWLALSILARVVLICIVPGVIYVPVRVLVGASPLPRKSPISVISGEGSPFTFLMQALFLASWNGCVAVIAAAFVLICMVAALSLVAFVFSVKSIPAWSTELGWPILGAVFTGRVALSAIQDVREERSSQ